MALFFGVDGVEAARRSSKRSASSQSSGGSRSSKRFASSQRGSSKRSGSNRRSKRSASPQRAGGSVADRDIVEGVQTTEATAGFSSAYYEELKSLIKTLQDKFDSMDKRIVELESKPVATTTTTSTASTTSSTTSSSASESTLTELGYLKGSADLCKPDSSGHKYCSVAINVDKKYNNGSYCLSYFYSKDTKSWEAMGKIFHMQNIKGEIIPMSQFISGKPTIFVMSDFSYYLGDDNSKLVLENGVKKFSGKYILLCGSGIGGNSTSEGFDLLDKKVKLFGYPSSYKSFSDAKGSIRHPFTSSKGDLVLMDVNGSPIIKYADGNLEYSPNLDINYTRSLKSYVLNGDFKKYFNVLGEEVK